MIFIGEHAPGFELQDTDGDTQALQTPAVVIFTCNHCPYALAWHDRLMDVARDYEDVHFYAINPNDAERYPKDSFEAMQERVRGDGGWPMPYMHDAKQEVAEAYGRGRHRTCSSWTRRVRCATAALRTATTMTRGCARTGSARRSTRCSRASRSGGRRPIRSAAASSGASDGADGRVGVAQVLKQRVRLAFAESV